MQCAIRCCGAPSAMLLWLNPAVFFVSCPGFIESLQLPTTGARNPRHISALLDLSWTSPGPRSWHTLEEPPCPLLPAAPGTMVGVPGTEVLVHPGETRSVGAQGRRGVPSAVCCSVGEGLFLKCPGWLQSRRPLPQGPVRVATPAAVAAATGSWHLCWLPYRDQKATWEDGS